LPKLDQNLIHSCFISQFATKKDIQGESIEHKKEKPKDKAITLEMLSKKKLELAERIKAMELTFEEIEGVKSLCKCLMTSTHLLEESVNDIEMQYDVVKFLILISNNLKNFLGFTKVNTQKLKEKIDKANAEIDSWKLVNEFEKKVWEEEQKKEKEKPNSKPLHKKYNELKKTHHQYIIDMERTKKELESRILILTLNNEKLLERVKSIEEDTDVIRTASIIRGLNMDLHQVSEMLMSEKEQNANVGFKLTNLLAASRKEIKDRDSIIERKTKEYEELLEKYNKIVREVEEGRNYVKKSWELVQMNNEERLRAELKIHDLEEEIREREEEIRDLSTKNTNLRLQIKLEREGLVQDKEVGLIGELFAFVWKDSLASINNRNKFNSREKVTKVEESKNNLLEGNEQTEVCINPVNPEKYSYLKPSYRSLVDSLIPYKEDNKTLYAPLFPIWLQVTMRAILDSKMNEILLSHYKGTKPTRFPEFVYSWLGTFHVDKATCTIKRLEYTEKESIAMKSRSDLLLGLEAASPAKLWEVNVFKDFLLEQLTLDELVYFLHCRFVLFRGPQLAAPSASLCVIPFATKQAVSETIDNIMHLYPSDERDLLKSKLMHYNAKMYGNTEMFDCNMVLRIMLEFYRKEKKENVVKFEKLFAETYMDLKSRDSLFPFKDFKDLLANKYDKNISDLEVCNIYKEAFIGGGSAVNSDSILLAFNETPFWIRYLRLKGLNPELKYDEKGDFDKTTERGKHHAAIHAYILFKVLGTGWQMKISLRKLRSNLVYLVIQVTSMISVS